MAKKRIETIAEKNRTIDRMTGVILKRNCFLLIGHQNPDEDCIASMVAFALILSKFSKGASIYLGVKIHENFSYLLNVCRYNSIRILYRGDIAGRSFDAVVVFDTPKPSMVESDIHIRELMANPDVVIMEFDHHLGVDSDYIGDEGYRLVTEASSASELVGHLAMKLSSRTELLSTYQIRELLSRNVILAMLTGIIGDSKMGRFLRSSRERRYYDLFTRMFNVMLGSSTTKTTNFSSMEQIFTELFRLSAAEEECFNTLDALKVFTESTGYVFVDAVMADSLFETYEHDTVVAVARTLADALAEESGRLSLVAYCDDSKRSDLIQFRVRRSKIFKDLDLRKVLDHFGIEDGGGHEGAIGFRFSRGKIGDPGEYVRNFVSELERTFLPGA